jgi:UDP-N-acetylmuramyl pentapeptide phosphotransferase/UDP-N-acetylglucosamine-1-phosphate transferase
MSIILHLLLISLIFFIIEIIFIKIAQKRDILDIPNDRSSHTYEIVRGGGVIFWFAGLFFLARNFHEALLFFSGLTIVGIVSFVDDLHNIKVWLRILSHVVGITFIFLSLSLFHLLPWYSMLAAYMVFIGILNAFNFMDGINGITGLYSLSVLFAFQWVNMKVASFITPDFIWYPMIASVVFLFFNFRKKAICFAGDVGSITVGFWIITLLIILVIKTGNIIWFLFLSVYGTDSIFTILHRLWLRQNIFKAHRLHFYQVLANECRIDHRKISTGYALCQIIISIIISALYDKLNLILLSTLVLVPLAIAYLFKFRILRFNNRG